MRTGAQGAVVLLAVLLAGCGGSSTKSNGEAQKSAAQILADAKAAAAGAASLHYVGTIEDNGSKIHVDLHLVSGKGGSGSITLGKNRIDIVRIGPKAYFKGTAAFYRRFAGAAAAQLLDGKWLEESSTSGDLASFTPLTDTKKFFALFSAKGALVKGAETTVDGQKVIAVRSPSHGGVMYVATTGTPYPVEVTRGSAGTIRFDGWNEQVALAAPKGAIDLAKLKG